MRTSIVVLVGCASAGEPQTVDGKAADDASPIVDARPLVACTGKAMQARDATWTVGGRSVRVHVPASYDPTRGTPIVLGLHGLDANASTQATVSRMNTRADSAGFVAVYPNGTGSPRGWNGGDCCNPAASAGVDDTAFIAKVLDEVEMRICVDPDRVHAIGLSNGGFLAHRLGCELSARIASIGSVAGVLGIEHCNPTRPVPVFQVHGTSDIIIPYGGGGVNDNEPVATTITRWTTHNGCTAAPVTTHEQGDAKCVRYGGCTKGADVELCTIDGGGHQWPGGESLGSVNGKKSDNLDATAAAWSFFAAHPR